MSQVGAPIVKTDGKGLHWPSALQFALSALGILFLWLFALISLSSAVVEIVSGRGDIAANAGLFLSAASFFFLGLILVPSTWLALLRLLGRPVQFPEFIRKAGTALQRLSLFLFLPLLTLGTYASQSEDFGWLLIPPVHLLAVGIIVAWLIALALRGLEQGSVQRIWGALGSGVALSSVLAFTVEIFALVFFLLFASLYLGTQPALFGELQDLFDQATFNTTDPSAIIEAFEPLLSDPVLLLFVLGFVAVAVPLIEELLKPMAVWLLLGRSLSPADGFVLGVLGGAGFALFEYLTLGISLESWLPIFVARIGTTAIHMFTSGLMGWAIVMAKIEKRYLLLLGSYALSVTLHGLWNSMAILGSFATLGLLSGAKLLPTHLIFSAWLVMLVLAIGSILLLRLSNRHLQTTNSELEATIIENSVED